MGVGALAGGAGLLGGTVLGDRMHKHGGGGTGGHGGETASGVNDAWRQRIMGQPQAAAAGEDDESDRGSEDDDGGQDDEAGGSDDRDD